MDRATLRRHATIRPFRQGDAYVLVLTADLDGFEAGTLVGRATTLQGISALRREYAVGIAPLPEVVQ